MFVIKQRITRTWQCIYFENVYSALSKRGRSLSHILIAVAVVVCWAGVCLSLSASSCRYFSALKRRISIREGGYSSDLWRLSTFRVRRSWKRRKSFRWRSTIWSFFIREVSLVRLLLSCIACKVRLRHRLWKQNAVEEERLAPATESSGFYFDDCFDLAAAGGRRRRSFG